METFVGTMKALVEKLPVVLFVVSLCLFAFIGGIAVYQFEMFPYTLISDAKDAAKELRDQTWPMKSWYYEATELTEKVTLVEGRAQDGLTLLVSLAADKRLSAQVVDLEGNTVHTWDVDWFRVWPDATHLPADAVPRARPGTHVHGALVLENGDLVFNYEHLGMVRLGLCGEIVWRLPYRTHHSIDRDEDGNFWVSGQRNREAALADFPNYLPPFIEPTVIKVSPEGEILAEFSVLSLLKENDLNGLLYLGTLVNGNTEVTGDTLHLNDVEAFPASLPAGTFKPGDVMVSLRNISAIFVFDPKTRGISYVNVGGFVRQHDPDFVDGDTISVFDNNNLASEKHNPQSRILLLSAKDGRAVAYYTGTETAPFFTNIMGKHQWLPNGNLLITSTREGRAFEIDPSGAVVWQYVNLVEDGHVGMMEEAQRLPLSMNGVFLGEGAADRCESQPAASKGGNGIS